MTVYLRTVNALLRRVGLCLVIHIPDPHTADATPWDDRTPEEKRLTGIRLSLIRASAYAKWCRDGAP